MTKIFIKTYGCALNQADSETIAALVGKAQFEVTKSEEDADLIIINSCAVKAPSEEKLFSYIKKVKPKKVIIAGCVPKVNPQRLAGLPMIGPSQIHNVAQIVEETLHDNPIAMLTDEDFDRLALPSIRTNPVIEIIPICRGCLGQCSYCVVKKARGKLMSYKINDILIKAQKAVTQGAREIWLTAQDTGCYGFDINTNLTELLKEIVKISGNFKVRVGMMNPNHILKIKDELIEIFQHEKIFKFIHIPVQSGNNRILKEMNRKYSREDYKNIVKELKEKIPNITIATDVIVAFPTETKEEFMDTVSLIKETNPDIVNISKYWKRKGTKAFDMKQVPLQDAKDRAKYISSVFDWIAYEQNKEWMKWEGQIIIDEHGKENSSIGRNFAYKPVIVQGDYELGSILKVKINQVTKFDLRAIII